MRQIIKVAHDFSCPWCWIGLHQARRLAKHFDVEFQWIAYELHPEGSPLPADPIVPPKGAPSRPTRLELAYRLEGMIPPTSPRPEGRSHNAHEAVEFARTESERAANQLIEAIYDAWWIEGRPYNEPQELRKIATRIVQDLDGMDRSIASRSFEAQIVPFDHAAYATGVYYVPTFWIAGRTYSEQPFDVLLEALSGKSVCYPYQDLAFPDPPADRPYTFVNMVSTIDGKTTTGDRTEAVQDLGSAVDHRVMRIIEGAADAVLIGAGSLRATENITYRADLWRFVATKSGKLPASRFFSQAPDRARVMAPSTTAIPDGVARVDLDEGFKGALRYLRSELGIRRLLVEGGSELNAALLSEGLIDELFLTVAPKIKLGKGTPTYAGGDGLHRNLVQQYELLEVHRVGHEVFLRYRRRRP